MLKKVGMPVLYCVRNLFDIGIFFIDEYHGKNKFFCVSGNSS